MKQERGQFSSKLGFVMAAAGSAVGLGNLWRFPYLTAQYGGGIFLLVYLLLAVTFGFSLMIAEIAIGRKTGLSAVKAYGALDRRFGFLGYLTALSAVLTLPYYSVIGGWVIKYFVSYFTGGGGAMVADGYFEGFRAQGWQPVLWMGLFVLLTMAVVMLGVKRGIEQVSKFMMPALILLLVGLSIYIMTLPGALEGVAFYFKPDFSRFSVKTVLAALGQLFYSMSLMMGIMVTYGSYMDRKTNLETSVRQIEIFDTGVAFLSGLMIVPAVFVFSGGEEGMLASGSGLMFNTLPKVFASTGAGWVLGGIFFLLVFFAALTSAISIMETIVSMVQDQFGWKRPTACLTVTGAALCMAVPLSLGFGVWSGLRPFGLYLQDFVDSINNSILMPVVALLTCLFIGYVIKPKTILDEVRQSSAFRSAGLFTVITKFVAPVLVTAILITSVLDAVGIFPI